MEASLSGLLILAGVRPGYAVLATLGLETRDTLAAALAAALGTGYAQAPAALSVSTTAAVRAAVLAGAAPAVISELAVADDLAAGQLAEVRTPELDLRRTLRVIWAGAANPPACPARDLVRAHRQPGDIAETSGSFMSSVAGLDQRAPDRGAGTAAPARSPGPASPRWTPARRTRTAARRVPVPWSAGGLTALPAKEADYAVSD